MLARRPFSPHFTNLLQLTVTLLVAAYMLLIGGSFNATVSFRVQLLNAIAASAIAVIWLGLRLRQHKRVFATGLEIPLAIFVGAQWLTTLTGLQPRLSAEQAATTTAWVFAFIILSDLLVNSWPKVLVQNALVLIAAFITIQALWEIGSWMMGWVKLGLFPLVAYRVVGFLGHPNLTAAALNLLLPLMIFALIRSSTRVGRAAFAVLIVGMLVVEFFTSSRSGWVGLGALAFTFLSLVAFERSRQAYLSLALKKWKSISRWLRLAVIVLLGLLLVGLAYVLWRQTIQASHPEFFSSRQYIWGPAWMNFLSQPLVGSGPGLYTWLYSKYTSIPPQWLAPHAHSVLFQTLSDSGLVGLIAGIILLGTAAYLFWRSWRYSSDRLWTVALISSAVGWFVHHQFDYFFGTPVFVFLFVIIAALAFCHQEDPSKTSHYQPLYLAIPLAGLVAFGVFLLRAAALNDQGLTAVSENNWAQAAEYFEQAAQADPYLPLYWQNAAYAETRAGNINTALPLWQRAVHDDPYWAIPPANLGLLKPESAGLQSAIHLAPQSDLLALNLGFVSEIAGDNESAQENYQRALTLNSASGAALFWQQTDLRKNIWQKWSHSNPTPPSTLDNGQQALFDHQPDQAIAFFGAAREEFPLSNAPYIGLARAYWLNGDEQQAQHNFKIAQLIPIVTPSETLQLYLFQGDWAEAHGDRTGAIDAYKTVFSIINDYTSDGPGTYGYPQRSWLVYHRPAPPSNLVPQIARADITAELDARFSDLAQWLFQSGDKSTACFILGRVYQEAPISQSGQLFTQLCPAQ